METPIVEPSEEKALNNDGLVMTINEAQKKIDILKEEISKMTTNPEDANSLHEKMIAETELKRLENLKYELVQEIA